jgi:hypothetical protein
VEPNLRAYIVLRAGVDETRLYVEKSAGGTSRRSRGERRAPTKAARPIGTGIYIASATIGGRRGDPTSLGSAPTSGRSPGSIRDGPPTALWITGERSGTTSPSRFQGPISMKSV